MNGSIDYCRNISFSFILLQLGLSIFQIDHTVIMAFTLFCTIYYLLSRNKEISVDVDSDTRAAYFRYVRLLLMAEQ